MDFQTAMICLCVVIISASVVYLTSIFGMKEKSYDEAREEAMRRLELLKRPSKKDRKDKSKKKKESKPSSESELDEKKSSQLDHLSDTFKSELHSDSSDEKDSKKNQISADFARSKLAPGYSQKPQKSIEITITRKSDEPKSQLDSKSGKKQEKKDMPDTTKATEEIVKKSPTSELAPKKEPAKKIDKVDKIIRNDKLKSNADKVEKAMELSKISRKVTSPFVLPELQSEISCKQLVNYINACPLDNDEIQMVIDALLNKSGDDTNQWKKKHDPVATLKDQLKEKQEESNTHLKNLEAARRRIKELKTNFDQEKSAHNATKEKLTQTQKEFNTLRENFQQSLDRQTLDSKAFQNKCKELQADLETRNVLLCNIQAENSSLKMTLQRLEAQRSNLERFQHEVDTLRGERAQWERRQTAMQQNIDDLMRQIKQRDEQIKSLNSARENDATSYKKAIKEMNEQLRFTEVDKNKTKEAYSNLESEKKALEEEIKRNKKQINDLMQDRDRLDQLLAKIETVNEEKTSTGQQLEQMGNELNKVLADLANEKAKNMNFELNKMKEIERLKNEENEEMKNIKAHQSKLEDKIKSLSDLTNVLKNEKDQMIKIISDFTIVKDGNIIRAVKSVIEQLNRYRDQVESYIKNIEELEAKVKSFGKTEDAELMVEKYKTTLANTEKLLKDIEEKMIIESNEWKEKCDNEAKIANELRARISQLEGELASEKKSIQTVSNSLRDQIKEMEPELKELKERIQQEEKEKKQLEIKLIEYNDKINALQGQLKSSHDGNSKFDELKKELAKAKEDLEKEKLAFKELEKECLKMKSLVNVGADELKAEVDKRTKLEELLKEKNIDLSPTTNGSATAQAKRDRKKYEKDRKLKEPHKEIYAAEYGMMKKTIKYNQVLQDTVGANSFIFTKKPRRLSKATSIDNLLLKKQAEALNKGVTVNKDVTPIVNNKPIATLPANKAPNLVEPIDAKKEKEKAKITADQHKNEKENVPKTEGKKDIPPAPNTVPEGSNKNKNKSKNNINKKSK